MPLSIVANLPALYSPDQPRVEFRLALNYLILGNSYIGDFFKYSKYYQWPATWLLGGIYSGITALSIYIVPTFLSTLSLYELVIVLFLLSMRLWKKRFIALLTLLIYAALPYNRVLHFCPQQYSLVLYLLSLLGLYLQKYFIVAIISISIITSHPITTVITLASIVISLISSKLVSTHQKSLKLIRSLLLVSIVTFAIVWNSFFVQENILTSVIKGLLREEETLKSLGTSTITAMSHNVLYKVLITYRYTMYILLILALVVTLLSCTRQIINFILTSIGGIVIGTIILNFLPRGWIDRGVMFFFTVIIPISAKGFDIIIQRISVKRNHKSEEWIILVFIFLSIVSILSYYSSIPLYSSFTLWHERHAAVFVASNLKCIAVVGWPSECLRYYNPLLKTYYISSNINTLAKVSEKEIIDLYCKVSITAVSPRERSYIYYKFLRSILWSNVDYKLSIIFSVIYNNGYFRILTNSYFYG